MDTEPLAFPALTTMLKAAGEATRLRILALIAEAELTVSDLTEILRQSQPRLSRHLRLLAEAGLVERFREGSWAFFRLRERGSAADIARAMITRLDANDPVIARDRERLAAVRTARATAAQNYFRRHAAEWDRIRKLHVADTAVEEAIRGALADKPIRSLLDLGTGTGRMLELFANDIERGLGRATSTTWRCRGIRLTSSSFTKCCTFSTTARAPSARRCGCCGRADGSLLWTLRRTIWNSCARSTPISGSALRRRR
jgi:DNA-binding transcriptional ArsR family regulator